LVPSSSAINNDDIRTQLDFKVWLALLSRYASLEHSGKIPFLASTKCKQSVRDLGSAEDLAKTPNICT